MQIERTRGAFHSAIRIDDFQIQIFSCNIPLNPDGQRIELTPRRHRHRLIRSIARQAGRAFPLGQQHAFAFAKADITSADNKTGRRVRTNTTTLLTC